MSDAQIIPIRQPSKREEQLSEIIRIQDVKLQAAAKIIEESAKISRMTAELLQKQAAHLDIAAVSCRAEVKL
jgi:hypothetical protein